MKFEAKAPVLLRTVSTSVRGAWSPRAATTSAAAAVLLALAGCGGGDPHPTAFAEAASREAAAGVDAPSPQADTRAPVVQVLDPAELSGNLTGTIDVRVRATDDVAVARVEIEIDGVRVGDPITAPPYQRSIDTADHPAGQHLIRARATDRSGNTSPWRRVTVAFGSTPASARVAPGFAVNGSWITGLTNATAFAQAPDGRFFVAQQGGAVRVVKNGKLLAQPFVTLPADDSLNERGLTGITLHPSFAANGRVFVHYTSLQGGSHNRVSRLVARPGLDVWSGSEQVLLDLPKLGAAPRHHGGALKFAPGNLLHIGVGDAGTPAQAQDLGNPFGKILRIREDGSAPATNPFYGLSAGWPQLIWAYGLRNPFTMAVQKETGRIFVNDVGEVAWEEINLLDAGRNYGWPLSEGPAAGPGQTGPLFAYPHVPHSPPGSGAGGFLTGYCVIGGAFYPTTGGTFPAAYNGDYLFSDYVTFAVSRLHADDGWRASAFARLAQRPVDMLIGNDGALYVLTRNGISRIAPL